MKKLIYWIFGLMGVLVLNLQLFANEVQTTLLSGAAGQSGNLSAEMKTFYDMTLIDEAAPNPMSLS